MDKSLINEKLRDILAGPEYFGGPQALSLEHPRAAGPLDSVTNTTKTAEEPIDCSAV